MKSMFLKRICIVVFILIEIFCSSLFSQSKTLKIWDGKIPGAINNPSYRAETTYVDGNKPRITKVTDPTLACYLLPAANPGRPAVVICPGGGYHLLAIDHEGYAVAEWLNTQGIAAFILTYRLPSDEIMVNKSVGPLQDAQEAIRIVRRHAKEWNIDPHKIGIMGFSAGGHLAATASTRYADPVYQPADSTSARPDFSVLVYPVISMDSAFTHHGSRDNLLGPNPSAQMIRTFSADQCVTVDTPPAFMVHAVDDGVVPIQNSLQYMLALKNAGVPCELHMYESGGHGFGLGGGVGTKSSWPEAFKLWLQVRKLL